MLVVAVIAMCLYSQWPMSMRVGVWYIAVTLLLALIGVTILQFVCFGFVITRGHSAALVPRKCGAAC